MTEPAPTSPSLRTASLRAGATVAAIGALALLPQVLGDYDLTLVTGAVILAIATMGFNITFGAAGQINLAVGAFFATGAYASALLTTKTTTPGIVAVAAGMAVAGLAAYIIAWPTSRLRGLYVAMATLAVGQGATAFLINAEWLTNGPVGVFNIGRPSVFGSSLSSLRAYYYAVLVIGTLVFLLLWALLDSRPGRAFRAVREDEGVARSIGVRAAHYKVAAFVIGSMVASVAGSLYAHFYGFVSPTSFDTSFSIVILSMAVVGGLGSNAGAVLGTFAIALIPEYVVNQLPPDTPNVGLWQDLIYGVSMLLVLLWAPRGIAGLGASLWRAGSRPWSRHRLTVAEPIRSAAAEPASLKERDDVSS